jgi:hypothetical protein
MKSDGRSISPIRGTSRHAGQMGPAVQWRLRLAPDRGTLGLLISHFVARWTCVLAHEAVLSINDSRAA